MNYQDSNVSGLLNIELSKIHNWLSTNRLTLNIDKTKFIVFHPCQKDISNLIPSIKINDIEIERVTEIKCLGVIFDETISWKPHIDSVSNKIAKYAGILNKLKNYLPVHVLRTLYFSMIHSNLNYGILIWGFTCQRLIKLQKKVVRIISCSKYNAHTEPILKALDIISLDDMLNLNALKFYYKYINNILPPYFYSFNIATQGSIHEHDTRHRDDLRTERTRTVFAGKRLKMYLPQLVNKTPISLLGKIATHSIQGFSFNIKRSYLQSYVNECSSPDCYVCAAR